jgi:hypothetical protein
MATKTKRIRPTMRAYRALKSIYRRPADEIEERAHVVRELFNMQAMGWVKIAPHKGDDDLGFSLTPKGRRVAESYWPKADR